MPYDWSFFFVYFYIAWCFVNGMLADQKNRSVPGVALLSLIATPLVVWLYIAFVPAKPVPGQQDT
jgi:hypothetical protein